MWVLLMSDQGYLMMITLRHAEEVIPLDQLEPPRGAALEPKEKEPGRQADRGAVGRVRSVRLSRPCTKNGFAN